MIDIADDPGLRNVDQISGIDQAAQKDDKSDDVQAESGHANVVPKNTQMA